MQNLHFLDETRSRDVLQKFIFHTCIDNGHPVYGRRVELAQTTSTKLIQCWYMPSAMITSIKKITYIVSHCFLQDRKTTYFLERSHDQSTQYLSSWVWGVFLLLFVWWFVLFGFVFVVVVFVVFNKGKICSYFSLCSQRYELNRVFCEGVKILFCWP